MDSPGQAAEQALPAAQVGVVEMMQAAQQQANAMMEMAKVLREKMAGERKDRFGDAGKVIRQPEIFALLCPGGLQERLGQSRALRQTVGLHRP